MIFEIVKIGKFLKLQIGNFRNYLNWKFLEFSQLEISGILPIDNFFNFPNWQFFLIFPIDDF